MGFYTEAARTATINSVDIVSDAPSFFIECAKTENMLFEGLIELDFAETYCNQGIISLTEADAEEANDKAEEAVEKSTDTIWTKFLEGIKHVFEKIKGAFEELAKRTIEAARGKLLSSKEVEKCTVSDVWFADYKKECDNILKKDNIREFIETFGKQGIKTGEEGDEASVKTASQIEDALDNAIERIGKIPTNEDEFKNKTNGKDPAMLPEGLKVLGKQDMSLLRDCLSLKGFNTRISNCFNMLARDDRSKFKVQKDDSAELKKKKHEASKHVTRMRMKYFQAECKVCSTTAKIAHRNYKEIRAAVKGKTKEETQEKNQAAAQGEEQTAQNSAAIFAGVAADVIFESIFEM